MQQQTARHDRGFEETHRTLPYEFSLAYPAAPQAGNDGGTKRRDDGVGGVDGALLSGD